MADRSTVRRAVRSAVGLSMLLALAAVALTACGSSSDTTTTTARPPVSRETADHLAKLSSRIADDLDAGDTCSAAHAADDLKAAVEDSDLPGNIRPGVDTVAADLVDQVNCPPPPPPPEPEKKPKKPKDEGDDHGNGDEHGNGNGPGNGPPGGHPGHGGDSHHGGFAPPGDEKLKGEGG
jgi:hypothetical protein